MTRGQLLRRNLRFHWRGNLAVFLGVAVGTAVLTGALLVGDSLRGSLREVTERQLGWVDAVLIVPRFFRADLANELASARPGKGPVVPVILLQASAEAPGKAGEASALTRRAGRITVWGVNGHFWGNSVRGYVKESPPDWSSEKGVVLNSALAAELGVGPGDTITLFLPRTSEAPRESLLGRRDKRDVLTDVQLPVLHVLPAEDGDADLSLNPSPAPPRNAFVPLALLQEQLKQPGRVNGVLVGGPLGSLPEVLHKSLTLDDWGLLLRDPEGRTEALFARLGRDRKRDVLTRAQWERKVPKALADRADPKTRVLRREDVLDYYRQHPYLSLESRQAVLEPAVGDAAKAAAKKAGLTAAPTLVYLVNNIAGGKQQVAAAVAGLAAGPVPLATPALLYQGPLQVPYSMVAALDPALPPPLGPFLPEGTKELGKDEIVLIDWPGWESAGMQLSPGETVTLTYYQPEEQGRLSERTRAFRLVQHDPVTIPLKGPAADPDLTPEFPGVTDKPDIHDWADDAPFPYDKRRIRTNDVNDVFWREHRTTPKAYVPLAAGQAMWGSRFGDLTSVRLAPPPGKELAQAADDFRKQLLEELKPEQGGFVFDPVRQRSLEAGERGGEFGYLFLGFSFFLIAAALLLVGLLFRLNLDRRAAEIGLLLAAGYRRRTVRRLLLAEGGVVAALGGLLGTVGAVGYAWGLLELLRSWWPESLDRSFLRLHVTPMSLLIGYGASLVVSVLTIAWAVRVLGRVSPSALLNGETAAPEPAGPARLPRWSKWIAAGAFVLGVALIASGDFIRDQEARAGTFFSGGGLLLTAGLAGLWALLKRDRSAATPRPHVATLGVRNAARNPARSLLTAGLLASAAFLIVAVESFRREPERDFLDRNGGSGGFPLLAEADVPVYQDLNSEAGRDEITDELKRRQINADALAGVTFYPFRLRAGDDASCLNLYQPGRPRLLGVPHALVERGGFAFAGLLNPTAKEKEPYGNPWLRLESPAEGGAIPVFGEKNTVEWMLHSKLGGEIEVPDERGRKVKLRIVGLLQDSVFQGELLMSEANFHKLYPSQEGYNFFLIDAPSDQTERVRGLLETALASRGFVVTPSTRRLEAYLAVENTYLSTFQALGGLGLLLGALGLAVVLLRSVWERRGELALLRALGFRRRVLGWLVFAENGFLLLVGLGVGTAAALLAVAPHLFGTGAAVPWLRLLGLLGLVLVVGLLSGAAALRATLRAPLLPALRRE